MIDRDLAPQLSAAAAQMPAVTVTGPRQSGKTTLCREHFPQHRYVSLEGIEAREFALSDPRGFLAQYPTPVVLDEVQRAPDLLSYIQVDIDEDPTPGRFILTGSQHPGLMRGISQSLAGRVALLTLLPLSLPETRRFERPVTDLWNTVWRGGYPRIHDRQLDAGQWLADYTATYVQRDVRQVLNVGSLDAFTTFLRLAAGRTGQELNLSKLGADVGVSYNTVRAWISVLEASYLIHRLPPWFRNHRKRTVKAPKVHFVDSGLVCYLLGITEPDQLKIHPLRGPIFESWVVAEVLKARANRRQPPRLFHLREHRGAEVDLILESGLRVVAVEVKSGATVGSDFLRGLKRFRDDHGSERDVELRLVYGGSGGMRREGVDVIGWSDVAEADWR